MVNIHYPRLIAAINKKVSLFERDYRQTAAGISSQLGGPNIRSLGSSAALSYFILHGLTFL